MICDDKPNNLVILGRVSGAFGIKGWVKLQSFTDPLENILHYQPIQIYREKRWQPLTITDGKTHGKNLVIHLADCADRDIAASYTNAELAIFRSQLPTLQDNEYYWSDLEGLTVLNQEGIQLGTVTRLLETGTNDVLHVQGEREYVIPYLPNRFILDIDLTERVIRVDWDANF